MVPNLTRTLSPAAFALVGSGLRTSAFRLLALSRPEPGAGSPKIGFGLSYEIVPYRC